jgi:Sulfotransferase domain
LPEDGLVNCPNFLVIGAQRAGTTLLHRILATHPEVYVPSQRKEVHYFDRYFERGQGWYAGYFPAERAGRRHIAVGEVTPDYLAHPQAADRIHATIPDCRLIAILRDPVDRAFSWYQYCRRNGDERRPFERFIAEDPTAVEYGLYHKHLSRYWELVPRHALKVMLYEDLIADPLRESQALAIFLGLNCSFSNSSALLADRINAGVVPRHRGAFALARRVGGYLMRQDINWPSQMAKRLGVREWFGREDGAATLDARSRERVGMRFVEDAIRLGNSLDRNLAEVWRLGQAVDGHTRPSRT